MYEIFEKLLKNKGITVYRVAKDTGLNSAMFTSWKKGDYTPKQDKLQKIADYFNVSVDYLMTGTTKENYYDDPNTARIAQEVFNNPDLKILFDAARNSRPEDIQMAADMLRRFKESNPNG